MSSVRFEHGNVTHLVVISVEQRQETRLRSRSSLDTPESKITSGPLQVSQIPQKLLNPQRCPLSNSRQLGRLEVGEAEGGKILVLFGKVGEP